MRILLIEDEIKVLNFVSRGLSTERYAVDTAQDGGSGLTLSQSCHYDLIILDLMLPNISGGEVLKLIRQRDSYVPVLVLTAKDAIQDKVNMFEAGADDYLTKPFA